MNSLVNTPRRLFLRAAGGGALALHSLGSLGAKRRSTVEVTEGPFFVDERLNRSDIRIDPSDGSVQDGLPLRLAVSVSTLDATGEAHPLEGVMVDLWHCDRLGRYSDVGEIGGMGGSGTPDAGSSTPGRQFLRGYQVSDANGRVAFQTVFPGWYEGRAPHIHCKVRGIPSTAGATLPTTLTTLTTQFFFDEALTRQVYTDPALPYRDHGLPSEPQSADMVYAGTNGCVPGAVAGDSLKLAIERRAGSATARFDIFIDVDERCRSRETHGPGGRGGPPPGLPPGRRGPTPWTV